MKKTNQYFKDAKANFIMKDRCCKAIQVVYEKYYNLAISKGRATDEAKKRGIENAADCDRPPIWGTIELCKAYAEHCNKVQYRDIPHYFCYVVISNENNTINCCVNAPNLTDCKKQCERLWGEIDWNSYTIARF